MRTVPMMDFPLNEYVARIARLRLQMEVAHVDGVLLTQEENLRYFCGARSTAWESKILPVCVLLVAADGRMALVCSKQARNTCSYTACVEENEISYYAENEIGMPPTLHEAIYDAMDKLGLTRGTIGFESGMVARVGISYNEFSALRAKLVNCRFFPFAEYIWNVRSIKSPREVEVFKQICDISGKCYQKAFDSVVLDKTTEKTNY